MQHWTSMLQQLKVIRIHFLITRMNLPGRMREINTLKDKESKKEMQQKKRKEKAAAAAKAAKEATEAATAELKRSSRKKFQMKALRMVETIQLQFIRRKFI